MSLLVPESLVLRSMSSHRLIPSTTCGDSRSNCTSVCLGFRKLFRTMGTAFHHSPPMILSQNACVHPRLGLNTSLMSAHAGGHCSNWSTTTYRSIRKVSSVNSRPHCSTCRPSSSSFLSGKQNTDGRPRFISQASVKTLSIAARHGGPFPRPPPSPGRFSARFRLGFLAKPMQGTMARILRILGSILGLDAKNRSQNSPSLMHNASLTHHHIAGRACWP
mmetsp:Transcript_2817/g.6584  ORF Transcript_2817/g.6584 Transcript_2817/m.6584 type:complete len:219 (+) Transcript_2817:1283-1939(+)